MSIKYPTGVEVHGKNLRIVFMYKGKRMRESLGIIDTNKNRKVAAGLRAAICYKIKTGEFNYAEEFPDSKNISIYCGSGKATIYEDIVKSWVSIKEVEISASTLKKYKSILNALSNFIKQNKIMSSFTHEDILLIRKTLLTSPTLDTDHKNNRLGRSVSTVNNYMRILKMVFEFAFNGGYTKTNIFSSVSELKKERVPPDPINQDEFARLLNAANNRQAANMLITSVYTGMRPGELCALAWEDIDFMAKTITVRRNISILGHFSLPKTKAGTDRVIHMLDPVLSCLRDQMPFTRMTGEDRITVATREYKKTREDTCTFVFQPQITACNGLKTKFYSPGGFGQVWNALIKKSGVRHRKAYQTRHTYACWMLSAGANPAFIATQMGHVSSKMIHDVYGVWMKENDADQIAIMNNNAPPMPQDQYRKAI